ncbi:hypothetical protein SCLCIDRAFT_1211045 [Scleroderma citrinum Foug A]|uniref:Uncharacterized protein n=1 Tax=Scleroderma citrinum Foug A TaxID=1036808 RepID=A0A0C3EEA2_9AGAM|nr:hypothetical protein SCLCIDRAFT_1211045 [Scleroderma citrinum Foug A]
MCVTPMWSLSVSFPVTPLHSFHGLITITARTTFEYSPATIPHLLLVVPRQYRTHECTELPRLHPRMLRRLPSLVPPPAHARGLHERVP